MENLRVDSPQFDTPGVFNKAPLYLPEISAVQKKSLSVRLTEIYIIRLKVIKPVLIPT
ncbi:hypothetical protein HMPREF0765_1801 [Sphingobacterium spiritivorum ATCC 33300]|uniref:Uncharacterized protein n=1 Tax=Sphingobacterium spiritivorum ATCC 33300 TaxID=525372 RepID=C2FWU5_SPHSI|nr:hypothetical protein HMPREF0765_1801 [Sphingobacterium spiritivorum ATCC 33300]